VLDDLAGLGRHSDIASGKYNHRPGFHAAPARCRQPGTVLVGVRGNRITRGVHTLSRPLEEGYAIRTGDMPGADDLTMRIYPAMARKEREPIVARKMAQAAASAERLGQYPVALSISCRSPPPASTFLILAAISATSCLTVGRRATCGMTVTFGCSHNGLSCGSGSG
jgi:hypothetical protein